jgi:nickel/cobalt tolerance cation efflux system protein
MARFTPVATSSLAIAAVMLPFAILGSGVGLEMLQPMAIVILGGLVTTVLHALIVLPALSAWAPDPEPDPDEEILEPVATEGSR